MTVHRKQYQVPRKRWIASTDRVKPVIVATVLTVALAACGSATSTSGVSSETDVSYPTHPITMVVPFAAGSQPDTVFRKVAELAAKPLGQPIQVEDVSGGASQPGIEQAMNSTPNGYTIGVASTNLVTVTPQLTPTSSVSIKKIVPIAAGFTTPLLMYANPTTPYRNFKEVVQSAKVSSGGVKVAIDQPESVIGITLDVLAKETHADLVGVPLGQGTEVLDVVNGTVPVGIASVTLALPYVKSGKLRALAQIGGSAPLPGSNTTLLSRQGYNSDPNGLNPTNRQFLFAPNGTPTSILNKLGAVFRQVLTSKTFETFEEGDGASPGYLSAGELEKDLVIDTAKATELIKTFSLKVGS